MSEEQKQQQSAQERLNKILGFDATKSVSGSGVLSEALAEIQAERDAKNKLKAQELIKKAIECCEKMEEAKSQFSSAIGKSEKELNKLISSIESLGGGSKQKEE